MSSGETAAQIRQGVEMWDEALDPLEAGIERSRTLQGEIREARAALDGLIAFFTGLKEHVEQDVQGNYLIAQEKYGEGGGRILEALDGTSPGNQHFQNIKYDTAQTTERINNAIYDALLASGYHPGRLIGHLQQAAVFAKDISRDLAGSQAAAEQTRDIHHPLVADTAESYARQLESGGA